MLALWNAQSDWVGYLTLKVIWTKLRNSKKVFKQIISEKENK